MGSGTAKQANKIAQASLNESKRQFAAQQAEISANKSRAKANALGAMTSGNQAYANQFAQSTDYTTGADGTYSLLTSGGTQSIIGSLLGGASDTLGG